MIEFDVAEGVSFSQVDVVRVRLSRTGAADIEFTLTMGAHGPREVHAIVGPARLKGRPKK